MTDDIKKVFREGETSTKGAARSADGEESLTDKLGNAGDDLRKELGNAGDDIRHDTDRVDDPDRRY
jgi:hypothetical protein